MKYILISWLVLALLGLYFLSQPRVLRCELLLAEVVTDTQAYNYDVTCGEPK